MSNPARLILLSGTGGSGTSAIAAATRQALEDEGLDAVLVQVDESSGGDAVALVASMVDTLAGWTHAEPTDPLTWSSLPSVRHLAAWRRVRELVHDDVDAVVVDCGDLRQARDLVSLPLIMLPLVESTLTPTTAMRRETEEAAPDEGRATAFDRLAQVRDELAEIVDLVQGAGTTMRLVCSASPDSVWRVLREASVLAMLGVDVDGIVLAGMGRKSDDLPGHVRAAQQEAWATLEQDVDGPVAWKSGAKPRPVPKGRSAMGPLGSSRVLRADALVPEAREEEFSLLVPLCGVAARLARVGRLGDALVVSFDGITRSVELPSMLRRCTPMHADRTDEGLRVAFVPDSSLWRGDSGAPAQQGSAA